MKALLCFLGLTTIALAAGPTTRLWTDKDRRQVEATFLRIEGDEIWLQTTDETVHHLPLANLSAEDQKLAKTLVRFDPVAGNKIDSLVTKMLAAKGLKPNPPSTDEQFLRRAYLSIIGRIPNYEEASSFLADPSPRKRDRLIDTLLNSDGYCSHLFNYFADMLRIMDDPNRPMERALPYIQWLKTQLKQNTPYNQIVYELITADGKMQSNGATGYLLRDSGMLLDNLANTFAVFLGTDLACAQCHDHPFADWTQKQFYELAAFFGATATNLNAKLFTKGDPKDRIMGEMTALAKESGIDMKDYEGLVTDIINANRNEVRDIKENSLRLPRDYKYKDGKPNELVKPRLIAWTKEQQDKEKAAEPKVVSRVKSRFNRPPKKDAKGGILPERLRDTFGAWLTSPENTRFSMTIANRLWKRAFGMGVAEPVTNVDDPALSANPALLTWLGQEMVRLNFDLKEFQRELYKTSAWQRACTEEDVPMGVAYYFQGPLLERMSAEQAWDSLMTLVLGSPDQYKGINGTNLAKTIDLDLDKTTGQTMAMKVSAYKKLQQAELARSGASLADAGGAMNGAAGPKIVRYGDMSLLRASELDQPAQPGHFLREFGQSTRLSIDASSHQGSTPQVLFLMNGPVQGMLTNPASLIFRTMAAKGTPEEKVESIFVSVFARRPTAQEKAQALKAIEEGGAEGYGNVIWALITSLEFLFVQ